MGTNTAYLRLMMPFYCSRPLIMLAVCAASLGLASRAAATATTFNFRDTLAGPGFTLDGFATGTSTVGGVTMTLTLFPDGVFNQTGSAFGINAAAGTDDTDEFDAGEGFTFSFNHNVTLDSVSVSLFGAGDSARISYDGGSLIGTLSATGTTLINSSLITSGTVLRFESLSGTFSLDSITVTAMPEPHATTAIAGAGILGLTLLHRLRLRSLKTPKPPSAG